MERALRRLASANREPKKFDNFSDSISTGTGTGTDGTRSLANRIIHLARRVPKTNSETVGGAETGAAAERSRVAVGPTVDATRLANR